MKNKREYPIVQINKKATKNALAGHPWIYATDSVVVSGTPEDGGIVDVITENGRYIGTGFYNSHSKIIVRILSTNANDRFDAAFFTRRIRYAVQFRMDTMREDMNCVRLIFGDSDGLPGFICDKFDNVLVTQSMCLGMEQRKDILFNALRTVLAEFGFPVSVIYERNDVAVREKEGLTQSKGFYVAEGLLSDTDGHIQINENGILYNVDYINGQKTGFFLDQKYNRKAAASLALGKTVLDCFTHTGAFALNCAAAGAEKVTAIDISADALETTKKNIDLNSMSDRINTKQADVFDLLTSLTEQGGHPYDYIILDPPAFTKSGTTVKNAYRGYKEINLKAMRLLPRGGYLATCSCSHFMTDDLFRQMLADAASDAGITLKQIEGRRQAPDHPILWGIPETEYLKFYLFQIV